ncbi:TRAP transporter substrate-binding protein [Terrihabitans rhizophilus]|uniref:TRAP transporter substrate-binding protein n=1 Tax=Terrihabitans rhizophilus TaxID=3092662 RepID=A0ABU4RIV7_9HYPH|nr:TRAP transporter substrate-binding protein [Terrihabitans sp. PJ23]MDX6804773.1 TRAP transporter substrate-binding protein [Terrihabitans sp. PJ23]
MNRATFARSIFAAALGTVLLGMPAFAAPLKMRMAGDSPQGALDTVLMQTFADNLKAKLGADFEYEFFHSGALGDENVHMQQIRTGQIDVYPMGSDAVGLDKSWSVFDMPFIFKDRAAVAKVVDGEIGERLRTSMRERAGLEVLAFGEIGFRQITNNVRAVKTPADFKGMKIRVPGSPTRVLMFKTLGASPMNMSFSEVYLALQSGTIDGQENPLDDIVIRSIHEVQKHISISNHVYTPCTLVMNLKKYESLSDAQKTAVKEAALDAAKKVREMGAAKDADLVVKLRDSGKITVSEIDLESFKQKSEPLYAAVGKIAGEQLAKDVLAAAAQ